MKVSIIIPTLKAEKELSKLVDEIRATVYYNLDLIIVSSLQSSAANRNTGLNKAKGDFIIMCDDDTEKYPQNWDKDLIDALNKTGASVVSARLLNLNGTLHACNHRNYDISKDFVEVHTIPPPCCVFRKTSLRFDEGFIGGSFEDTDFFRRMDGKCFIANTVRVVHRQEGIYTTVKQNRAYYNKKWRNILTPIFIITCDRLETLKQSIKSYQDFIKTPFEIVIIDFGSSYGPTLEYLKNLEHEKIKVHWKEKIANKRYFNIHIDEIIQNYFKDHPISNYIVTDPDIVLDNVDGDILDVYAYLLGILPENFIVGPMLKIDDLPDHYPLKNIALYYERMFNIPNIKVNAVQYKGKTIKYIFAKIDTTFAMNRAGTHWRRHRKAVRVLSPYAAKHLEWYLDPKNLTEDQKYYMEHASRAITHTLSEDENKEI